MGVPGTKLALLANRGLFVVLLLDFGLGSMGVPTHLCDFIKLPETPPKLACLSTTHSRTLEKFFGVLGVFASALWPQYGFLVELYQNASSPELDLAVSRWSARFPLAHDPAPNTRGGGK